MQKTLKNSLALVTGATAGIGKAIALRLAREGIEVVVHGRDVKRGEATVKEIQAAGGRARFSGADLQRADDVARLAKEVGAVDILINNAGQAFFGATAELSFEKLDAMHASNVRAPYILVSILAPQMVAKGGGSIINIGSMAGELGLPGAAAYSATKAANSAMTRAWTAEYSARNVRINTVAPGPVSGTNSGNDAVVESLGGTTAMKRTATADEIAEAVLFLVSPAASYITGATLPVDGGRTAI